jgi:glycosyltransferase involved in cell wall biosynthesis
MSEWSASGFASHVVVLDRGGTAPRYEGFSYRRVPFVRALESATQRLFLEEICRAEGADVFVSTYYTHPLRCRSALLVHDMIPEVLGWDLGDAMWEEKHSAIRHATSYIANSESTASDFRRLCPQETRKPLVVITPGLDPVFYPAPRVEIENLTKTFGLPKHFFLFTGQRHGYKNAQLLFSAAAEFQAQTDMALLCVGGAPALEPEFADLAGDLAVRVASLSDSQMRAAYSGAAALVYVSKYEGFGLPLLEAMACGCPVITCDNSSQKEVAGPAAVYVGDSDPAELAKAMRSVLDPSVRAEMINRGRKRSTEFAWVGRAAAVAEAVRQCALLERY